MTQQLLMAKIEPILPTLTKYQSAIELRHFNNFDSPPASGATPNFGHGELDQVRDGEELMSPLRIDANAKSLWEQKYDSPNNRKKKSLEYPKTAKNNAAVRVKSAIRRHEVPTSPENKPAHYRTTKSKIPAEFSSNQKSGPPRITSPTMQRTSKKPPIARPASKYGNHKMKAESNASSSLAGSLQIRTSPGKYKKNNILSPGAASKSYKIEESPVVKSTNQNRRLKKSYGGQEMALA